ncbi:hypothetical protein VSDG_09637 [Cytospora chrysosperma]|uniref:Uncharacterized protein n=1 Tax=Cytospora chrysosperma TaxID=252740 RepID=A0A423V9V7_CYTCH|nr:hypothetical protein VSDG_09637 [Valsa sordida]
MNMDAPMWKLDKLKASGQQQVNRAAEAFAFAGFCWPKDKTAKSFVDAERHPGVFLILDPVYLREDQVVVARTDSSAASKRLFEIFDKARLQLLDEPLTLDIALKQGFLNVPLSFYERLKARLVEHDQHYKDFGFLVFKKTIIHFGEAAMDEYKTTDKTIVKTKAVYKAWKSVKDFLSLVSPHHGSLQDPRRRKSGVTSAPSRPTASTKKSIPAVPRVSTKLGSSKQSSTALPSSKRPSSTLSTSTTPARASPKPGSSKSAAPKPTALRSTNTTLGGPSQASRPPSAPKPAGRASGNTVASSTDNSASHRATANGRGNDAASKRKPESPPASSSRPEKSSRRDLSASHMGETASQPEESEDLRSRSNNHRQRALEKAAEVRDLERRVRFIEGAFKANDAMMQKELILKVMEAAALQADNQRLKEIGSFRQRLEINRQTLELKQKTARIRELEETEGNLRKRIEELEALQEKQAD